MRWAEQKKHIDMQINIDMLTYKWTVFELLRYGTLISKFELVEISYKSFIIIRQIKIIVTVCIKFRKTILFVNGRNVSQSGFHSSTWSC